MGQLAAVHLEPAQQRNEARSEIGEQANRTSRLRDAHGSGQGLGRPFVVPASCEQQRLQSAVSHDAGIHVPLFGKAEVRRQHVIGPFERTVGTLGEQHLDQRDNRVVTHEGTDHRKWVEPIRPRCGAADVALPQGKLGLERVDQWDEIGGLDLRRVQRRVIGQTLCLLHGAARNMAQRELHGAVDEVVRAELGRRVDQFREVLSGVLDPVPFVLDDAQVIAGVPLDCDRVDTHTTVRNPRSRVASALGDRARTN